MKKGHGKISVVIADDTTIVREGLGRIIGGLDDFELIGEASSIEEAIDLVRSIRPDILLLDLKWFGDETAGISAISQIRALRMPKGWRMEPRFALFLRRLMMRLVLER